MKQKLQELLNQNQWNIKWAVIQEILDSWYNSPKSYLDDLLQHGCVSWMVISLIYYKDTHDFYDKHYSEIEDIRYELEEEWILPKVNWDLKNHYAWLSFEHRAYQLYHELKLDRELEMTL